MAGAECLLVAREPYNKSGCISGNISRFASEYDARNPVSHRRPREPAPLPIVLEF
jgi:hypothetical protein